MLTYVVRRLIAFIPSLFVVAIVAFSLMHFIPGDPASVMLGPDASINQIDNLRTKLGLDKPIYVQFCIWLTRAGRGDLGDSVYFHEPVLKIIGMGAETSILLMVFSMIVLTGIGVSTGIIAAIRPNGWLDQLLRTLSLLAASIPTFWLALNMMLLFASTLGWLPSSGFPSIIESKDLSNLRYLVLPAFALGFPNSAFIARLTRSSMLDVLSADYITVARGKGLPYRTVILKHALRNAAIPVVTVLALTTVGLVSGAVVTETVFALPGVGRLVVESVLRRDYPVIQGILLVVAILYMVVNLATDLLYSVIDPRIRYG